MNVFDEHPFKVIVDYGHNPAAVKAMCDLADRLEVTGQRLVVLAAPGDRRDEDILAIAQVAAGHFDHYFLRRDDDLRGRGPDEVPNLLAAELRHAGVPDSALTVIPDEITAIEAALQRAHPGDLLIVFADNITRTWKQVIYFSPAETRTAVPLDTATPPPASLVDDASIQLDMGPLVRDGRGVRLAKPEELED
jgi:cyanophycin synthetase